MKEKAKILAMVAFGTLSFICVCIGIEMVAYISAFISLAFLPVNKPKTRTRVKSILPNPASLKTA